jgi:hypothetical protein
MKPEETLIAREWTINTFPQQPTRGATIEELLETVKNGVFSDVMPCGSCNTLVFGISWYFFAAYVGC